MLKLPTAAVVLVATVTALPMLAGGAAAQQSDPAAATPSAQAPAAPDPAASAAPAAPPPTAASPASPAPRPAIPTPPGVVATTNNPNLAVATVKLESGTRLSRLIGSAVYNDQNERVGSIDDLVMTQDNRVTMAVVSVGGFLGLGSKLVAVPWNQLRPEAERVVLPGVSKEQLNDMPSLIY